MTASDLSPAVTKAALRQKALARRAALAPTFRIECALTLADLADELVLPPDAVVAGYWPLNHELDPRPLLMRLRERGHRLCLPVVAEPHLIFRLFGRDTAFEPAGFGTMAPGPEAEETRPDALLMPLSAFDGQGNRIGYGKGHYDVAITALTQVKPVVCVGLAFATQEVPAVPVEPHDKPLHAVLTENGLMRF